MEEKLITFETAKLAKEKGFNTVYRDYVYDENGEKLREHGLRNYPSKIYPQFCCAPRQSLLKKWLLDKHFIFVYIYTDWVAWYCKISRPDHNDIQVKNINRDKDYFGWNEEALEQGLKEALKLI